MNISKLHIPGAKNLGYVIAEPSGPTPWLVENWIIEGEMAVVHGAANVGKSFAVLDMGLHIALGEKEWVRNSIPRNRPVIYIPSEGMRGVERRLRTWLTVNRPETLEWTTEDYESADLAWMEMDKEGLPVVVTAEADPTAALPFYVYTGEPEANWPILLDKTEEGTRTLEYLREFVAAVMALYYVAPVIIVDVVGNFAPGLDENSREFGHALDKLHPRHFENASVILVHHEGYNAGRVRGHSSVTGLVDCSIGIEARDDSSDLMPVSTTWLKVTNGKQRNEERTRPMVLTLEKPDPSAEAAMITGRPDSVSEPMLLAMFGRKDRKAVASAAKGEVTDPKDQAILLAVRNGARKPKEIVETTNIAKGTEHRHRKDLMKRGLLIEEEDGLRLSFPGERALNSSSGGREGVK